MGIRSWIQKHPLLAYFLLAFLLSWGSSLVIMGPKFAGGGTASMQDKVLALFGMLLGPCLSGLVLTRIIGGRDGMQALAARVRRWRLGLRWYAAALLIFPAVLLGVLTILRHFVSPAFAPGFFWIGLVYGLLAGFLEEIGWTGFAVPRMVARYGALGGGALLGLLHGLWHIFADYLGSSGSLGAYWFPHFAGMWIIGLVALRIIMVWLYSRTSSLLLAQLMHASFTGPLVAFSPSPVVPANETFWYWIFSAAIWMVALVVIVRTRGRLGQPAEA